MSASIGKLSHQVRVVSRCQRLQPLLRASASVCENGDGKTFTNQQLDVRLTQLNIQTRCYSQQSQRKGFISGFIDNIKQEINKNKEMKDNIKKFREEAEKLEQSDALQEARKKFENLEKETAKGSAAFRHTFDDIKDKVSKGVEEAQKQEWVKKGMDDLSKTAKGAAERVSKSGEDISKSAAFKTISESVKAVKEEIDESTTSRARPYKAPTRLRKRTEGLKTEEGEAKTFEANEDATGVVLHKDSKWYQQWKNFSENNQVFNKMFDLKMRYDESDNIMIRASKAVTDRVSQLLGGVFSPTELSGVLTEIIKIDPTFTKEGFLKMCELEIIPNILEAMIRGDLEIIKDWCYEAPYNQLATPIKQATAMGYKFDSKVLDVDMVELSMGKMMDQGPVLVITFVAQQIMAVRNAKGVVVEGDLEKVMRVTYVWVLCRDQEVLDPSSAWRLLDMSAHSAEQWV